MKHYLVKDIQKEALVKLEYYPIKDTFADALTKATST